ncbi:hypothetical protein ACFY71_39610 [Streptomyces cinerochromogenes]|uniref:hypothetical protein n=1 Tax=Streptomyces cinerochromogenes TaxID=66422 RepID=UPI0036B64EEE
MSSGIEPGHQIPALLPEVGPGWRPLLQRLHDQLVALAPDYRVGELRVKLGGLRIYIADRFGRFKNTYSEVVFICGALYQTIFCAVDGGTGEVKEAVDASESWEVTDGTEEPVNLSHPRVPDPQC